MHFVGCGFFFPFYKTFLPVPEKLDEQHYASKLWLSFLGFEGENEETVTVTNTWEKKQLLLKCQKNNNIY